MLNADDVSLLLLVSARTWSVETHGRRRIRNTYVCFSISSYAVASPRHDRNDPKGNRTTNPHRTSLPVTVTPAFDFGAGGRQETTEDNDTRERTTMADLKIKANQELFIFRKGEDGQWRIARYSFSPTNPPGA
jgi:hypothetical protein